MNQAEVTKLISQLKVKVNPRLRKFSNPKGPEERLNKLRKTVTALIKHERIQLNYPRADEAQMYAERLISDAIRYGDCHKTTMEMADYWLVEKQLVHKLFKVLVPRFENYTTSYTRMYNAPRIYHVHPVQKYPQSVLELRGNPYPPLLPDHTSNRNLIHNVLLDEAKKAYRAQKYKDIASKVGENVSENSNKVEVASKQAESDLNVESKVEKVDVVKADETSPKQEESVKKE